MCTYLIFLPYSVPIFIQMKHLHLFPRLQTSQLWFCSSGHLLMFYRQETEEQSAAPNFSCKLHCIWMKNYMLLFTWKEGKYLLCLNHHYNKPLSSEKADLQWSECSNCNTLQPAITSHNVRNWRAPPDLSWHKCKSAKAPEISHSL